MKKRSAGNWRLIIEGLLRQAVLTTMTLPPAGPRGFKSCMPSPVQETPDYWDRDRGRGSEGEKKLRAERARLAYDAAKRQRLMSRNAFDVMDLMIEVVPAAELTEQQRCVICWRAHPSKKINAWKIIVDRYARTYPDEAHSRRHIQELHRQALITLAVHLIKNHQDRLANIRLRNFTKKAA